MTQEIVELMHHATTIERVENENTLIVDRNRNSCMIIGVLTGGRLKIRPKKAGLKISVIQLPENEIVIELVPDTGA